MRRPVLCLALLLCLSGAARGQSPAGFVFGMEYAFPGTTSYWAASQYAELGATSCKFNGKGTFWGDVETAPPVDGVHSYDWSRVDESVDALHRAGFTNLTVVIGSQCAWGSEPLGDLEALFPDASTMPKDEHLGDYIEWVFSFVERYDMDGVDDMPGLAAPILNYEILTEAQHYVYWYGDEEDYVTLLRISYEAVKAANPATQVILSGFWFADIFDGGPLADAEMTNKFFSSLLSYFWSGDLRFWILWNYARSYGFNRRILEEGDYFDAVEFHLLSNYTAVEGTADFIRREMAKNGYNKPIWIGDCGALPQIPCHDRKTWDAVLTSISLFQPARYADGDVIFDVLTQKTDAGGYTYPQVLDWYYRDQACHLAKSLIAAMGNGLAGANVFTWLDGLVMPDMLATERNWQIGGLREGGLGQELPVGPPRPSFHTYKLIVARLGGFASAAKVLGTGTKGTVVYRFDLAGGPVFAAWYDEAPIGPGNAERPRTVNLSSLIGKDQVEVTRIITRFGVDSPAVETASASALTLTDVPVLIR